MFNWIIYKKQGIPCEIKLERYMEVEAQLYFFGNDSFWIPETNKSTTRQDWLTFLEANND